MRGFLFTVIRFTDGANKPLKIIIMEKLTKSKAVKLFNAGLNVTLCPSKCNPNNSFWSMTAEINNQNGGTFEQIINAFHYYNCNKETGNAIHFYKN